MMPSATTNTHLSKRWLATACLLVCATFAVSCGDEDTDPAPASDDATGTDTTAGAELPLQQRKRFPIGGTFYLPGGGWSLTDAPGANDNALWPGDDGYTRFTPIVKGDYAFERDGERETLTVVEEIPYEHYNYYPTRSLAAVGDETWVAHVFDPHLSRLDTETGEVISTVKVGPWPVAIAFEDGMSHALVAHKAGDTVGFVNVETGKLEDALWVGDEPAEIALTSGGAQAWVSLTTENAVVLVDVAAREVIARVETNPTPTSLALTEDGATLFVASYRSGVSDRLQFGEDDRYDKFDVAVVDTASLEVRDYIEAVGSVLGGMTISNDRLYVSTTRAVVSEYSGDLDMTAFRHSVAAYDLDSLDEVVSVDIGRQESATGLAVRPFGLVVAGDTLWVALEGSDIALGLDPATLAEKARFEVTGRPRAIHAAGDALFVHGLQDYSVTRASADGALSGKVELEGDPRDPSLALGQRLYTGTGERSALNHSCADCHVDGLTDGNVWSAGGFSESSSRPMFWMEGSDPIGWEGDAFDLFSYLYGSPGPTIGVQIDTAGHQAFYDYLASFVPPPPGNGLTLRDGSMTEAAKDGESVFMGAGACAGCHGGPLKTRGLRLEEGGTQDDHPIVVPSLVGIYRHGSWLVNGAAHNIEESVVAMEPLAKVSLEQDEVDSIVRYLQELSAREFFLLTSNPRSGQDAVRSEGVITLTFSHPVWEDADNLGKITLTDASDAVVEATVTADARHVTITPAAPLTPGADYKVEISEGFEAWGELVAEPTRVAFEVAGSPALRLEGDYVINVDHPNLDFPSRSYDPSVIIPVKVPMTATPSAFGAIVTAQTTDILEQNFEVVVDGEMSAWPPFAFPVGPGFLNRSFPTELMLVDDDGDGVADSGEGRIFFRSPGLEATDVRWTLGRPVEVDPNACEGQTGDHAIQVEPNGDDVLVTSWEDDVNALGFFVTAPEATVPLGPGPVTGGEAYFVLSTTSFPGGFEGPVTYGEVPADAMDATEASGGMAGGTPLPASTCVKVSVVFSDFTTTELRLMTAE